MERLKAQIKKLGRKRIKQIGAGALTLAVVAGSVTWAGLGAWANNGDPEAKTKTEEAIEKEYPNLLASPDSDGKLSKEETAYVVMDADSQVKDISVSEWLKNGTGADSINDVSVLKDIENTANNKEFTQDGNKLTWAAGGSDIKYKGTTDKEIPVKVSVSYYLDGEKMSASEIAGKSGHVKIRFDYTVKDSVQADGYTFTTPYTMASGVMLDDEHFTDIKVEGGKVIDDGGRCICLGIAFPGIQGNLNADISTLDIPESVVIEAYTDKFEIDGSYTVALTGIFSDMDFSDTGSIEGKIGELESALDQLGSASDRLVSGAADLASGADKLVTGANKVESGAEQLQAGADQLSSGLSQISSKSGDLNKGAKQVFESLLQTAETQLKANGLDPGKLTIGNYQKALTAIIDSLDKDKVYSQAEAAVKAEVEKNRSTIEEQVTAAVKQQVTEGVNAAVKAEVIEKVTAEVKKQVTTAVLASRGMTPETYEAGVQSGTISDDVKQQIEAAIAQQMASDTVKSQIDAAVAQQMASDEIKALINQNIADKMESNEIKQTIANQTEATIQDLINRNMQSAEIQAQLAKAAEGAKSVIALKSSLDDYRAFYLGVLAYTEAVDTAKSGASDLSKGAKELSKGTEELADGAEALSEGSRKLYDGMSQFNREGIQKLISTLDDAGVEDLMNRIKALADASSQGSFIGGKADNMNGESRIIFKTEAVKAN